MKVIVNPVSPRVTFKTWAGFFALCIGMFMAVLDIQVVVTSLTVIEEALKIGADRMSWVQTAYLIAEVITIPLTGMLIRVFSVRWLFAGAVILFTLASLGCALSYDFNSLIIFRVLQGAAGGVLIPLVFTAVFLMFPPGIKQVVATTIGGILAVMAPTLGPIAGGWITEHYTWHWLFLVNIVPGIITLIIGVIFLPRAKQDLKLLKHLDWFSVILVGVSLAALLIALKEAPERGWTNYVVVGLFMIFALCLVAAIRRPTSVISFWLLKDRNMAYGCGLSFLLGAALYGSIYLLPLYLSLVQAMGPMAIGMVTLVTGISQLISAPINVYVDRKLNARWLLIIGFVGFGIGLAMSSQQTITSTYDDLFWPQVLRGLFVALCILPAVRVALGFIPKDYVPDGSGLFNVSRNLGGAIGIAIIDTMIFTRTPRVADDIITMISSAPQQASALLAMPVDELPVPDDVTELMSVMDVIQQASLTTAINECWLVLSAFCAVAVIILFAMGPIRRSELPPDESDG